MGLETEQALGPPRWFYPAVVLLIVVLVGSLVSVFAFRLQPQITSGVSCPSGDACIEMPSNAAVVNFDPINSTVVMGTNNTILWTNEDTIQHTVVICAPGAGQECSPAKAFASSAFLSHGDTFTATLNYTGVWHFFCSIHPATMKGTIIVVNATTSSGP
jgi:plastocyanin